MLNMCGLPWSISTDAERLQREREDEKNEYFDKLAARDAALRKARQAIQHTGKGEKSTEKQEENTDESTI